jgi:hypothetical protein
MFLWVSWQKFPLHFLLDYFRRQFEAPPFTGVSFIGSYCPAIHTGDQVFGASVDASPKHGSWLHMAEIELNVLTRQRLDRQIPDKATLIKDTTAWRDARNCKVANLDC